MFREVIAPFTRFRRAVLLFVVPAVALPAVAKDTIKDLQNFDYVISKGILQGVIAKELCSCRYVLGLSIEQCKSRSEPFPDDVFSVVTIMDDAAKKQVTVYPAVPLSNVPAMAIFNRESTRKGCRLVYGMQDARR